MLWHDLEIEATSEPGQGHLEWFSKVKWSYQLNEGILALEGSHQEKKTLKRKRSILSLKKLYGQQ